MEYVEMRPGVMRPTVDFGTWSGYYKSSQYPGTAGLRMSLDGKTASGFSDIVEAFTVFSDWTGSGRTFIFTDSGNYHYHRNGDWILTNNEHTQKGGTKDGYHAVDGQEVAYNYSLPAKRIPSLFVRDGQLWLRVVPRGAVLIVR